MAEVPSPPKVHIASVAHPTSIDPSPIAQDLSHEQLDDSYDDDDEESEGEDDAGSLVDFIVEDEDEDQEEEEEEADARSDTSEEPTKSAQEESKRELEGIDASNIISGKRTRRQTNFYESEVFSTAEYRKMMLADIPSEEMHVVEEDDSEEEDEEGIEDDSWSTGGSNNEDEEEEGEQENSDCDLVAQDAPKDNTPPDPA